MNEIASEAGWHVSYVETDWASFPAGLKSRRFDVSISPTFATIQRALAVNFTRPLFYAGNSAIGRTGDKRFPDVESLNRPGITIAVTAGEAGHEYALANLPRAKIIVHTGGDEALTLSDVLSGRADVALGDSYMTAQYAAAHHNAVQDLFANDPYNLSPVSWSVAPGELELLSFLNTAIDTLDSQGKLRLYEKRYGAHWLHLSKSFEHD